MRAIWRSYGVEPTVNNRASAKEEEAATTKRRLARRVVFFIVVFLIVSILTIITISTGHASLPSPGRENYVTWAAKV
jgi:hypothetical protein